MDQHHCGVDAIINIHNNETASERNWFGMLTTALLVITSTVMLILAYWYHQKSNKHQHSSQQSPMVNFSDPTLHPSFHHHSWYLHRGQENDDDDNYEWQWQPTKVTTSPWPNFHRETNPNASDLIMRQQQPSPPQQQQHPSSPAIKTMLCYANFSQHHGCVPNDYGGPMFLLPGLIIALYVTRSAIPTDATTTDTMALLSVTHRAATARYILQHQQPDGGWGTHISGATTNFCSTLNYVALRLLGVPATHEACVRARLLFQARGQAASGAPLWAKVWFAILGVYEWQGVPPVPPELWLLPSWFPFHLGNTWCHARLVALPMSYLYGAKFVYPNANNDVVIKQLRKELYPEEMTYDNINWTRIASQLDPVDTYGASPSWLLTLGNHVLTRVLEPMFTHITTSLRLAALEETTRLIVAEDVHNQYICLGPVNKALNMVCAFARGDVNAVTRHWETTSHYLWVSEDGMKMQGYVNSMVWDASFALLACNEMLQANKSPPQLETFAMETRKFILRHQQTCNTPDHDNHYRDPCLGGWGFGTKANTYIVSDCTAEALRAVLCTTRLASTDATRIENAVDLILWMQNSDDGAWASYEKRRGYAWYELLNPALVFSDIMIDYSYLECTSSCVQALAAYCKHEIASSTSSPRRREAALCAITKAIQWIVKQQNPDGSWFGKWGVCYTYASMFACEALTCMHDKSHDHNLVQTVQFLCHMQNSDGGWGEHVDSCVMKQYVTSESTVVHTAWAMMAICAAFPHCPAFIQESTKTSLARAYDLLLHRQDTMSGDFPVQEGMYGVFNKTCGVTYTSYRHVFTAWAMSRYEQMFVM